MAHTVIFGVIRRLCRLPVFCLLFAATAGCSFLLGSGMDDGGQAGRDQTRRSRTAGGPENRQRADGYAPAPARQAPEAENAYAQAVRLWRKSSAGEVCSDPVQAVALLDKAVAIAPEYGEAYLRRGLAKSEMGEFEEAFEDATAGVRLAPSPEAYAFRGLVLLRGGQPKAARRDLEYSLDRAPAQHLAHNFLGILALSEDNAKEACRSFTNGCSNGDCFFLEAAQKGNICPR